MFRVQDYLVLCQTFSYCVFAKKKIPTKNPTASATKMQKWKNISLVISAVDAGFFLLFFNTSITSYSKADFLVCARVPQRQKFILR